MYRNCDPIYKIVLYLCYSSSVFEKIKVEDNEISIANNGFVHKKYQVKSEKLIWRCNTVFLYERNP